MPETQSIAIPARVKDLTGQQFGRLTAIRRWKHRQRRSDGRFCNAVNCMSREQSMSVDYLDGNGTKPEFGDIVEFPNDVRCHLAITRDDDGEFSAIVLNLPGTGSCGATIEEAIANVRDAVVETIATYVELGEEVPWETEYRVPCDAMTKWILVNA